MYNYQSLILYISFLTYFLFSIIFSFYSFPQEDALIIYRYVNNLVETGEILFNIDGPHTEGATDFFWLIYLGFFKFIGFDPFLISIITNSLALTLIMYLIIKEIAPNQSFIFYIFALLIFLNLGQIVGASVFGFSTLIFCVLGLLVYRSAYLAKNIQWCLSSIIFCLLRPEAVIFFLPTILIAYNSNNQNIKKFFYFLLIICFVGAIYFLWRYIYFSEFLPLPLMVKQIGGETSLRRFLAIISQILSTFTLSSIVVIFTYLISNRSKFFSKYNKQLLYLLLIILVTTAYIFSFSTGYASQNIFFRYFAPVYFIIFLMTIYSLANIQLNKIIFSILIIILTLGSLDNSNLLNRIFNIEKWKISQPTSRIFSQFSETGFSFHPIVQLSHRLKNYNKDLKIMLTEAGAIPYFSDSFVIDMTGLNNSTFAKRPVICSDFEYHKPTFIEIDVGPLKMFSFRNMKDNKNYPSCGFVGKKELFSDSDVLKKDQLFLVDKYENNYFSEEHEKATVNVAPLNTLYCMQDNDFYDLIFINKRSDQIYFINSSSDIKSTFEMSCEIKELGYFKNE